jgi:hypothetical protein
MCFRQYKDYPENNPKLKQHNISKVYWLNNLAFIHSFSIIALWGVTGHRGSAHEVESARSSQQVMQYHQLQLSAPGRQTGFLPLTHHQIFSHGTLFLPIQDLVATVCIHKTVLKNKTIMNVAATKWGSFVVIC